MCAGSKYIIPRRVLLSVVALCVCLFASCVSEDEYSNTPSGNFDALWTILDEHYCFFPEKQELYGVDWNECRQRYKAMLTPSMTREQLFEVCGKMLNELRDGHVNLSSSFNTARYWEWFEAFPVNYSDSIMRRYIGTDYRLTCGIRYCILPDNIGYMYIPSFDTSVGQGNLDAIFSYLALCDGLIVDVRNNEGGLLQTAQDIAASFINEKTVVGYMSHKTGKGHSSFSAPAKIELTPSEGIRWQKQVCVLTNRRTYSAANAFVMYLKDLPLVTVIGDRTGGGAGMPFLNELPNGWTVRFSACPTYDVNRISTESGIDPDIHVDMTSQDYLQSTDNIIDTARRLLKQPSANQ